MGRKCCMPGCKGNYKNGPKVHSFQFPANAELRKRWIHAVHRKHFTPSKFSVVCHLHFKDDEVRGTVSMVDARTGETISCPLIHPRLIPGAVPSIVPNFSEYPSCTAGPSRDCPETKKIKREWQKLDNIKQKQALVSLKDSKFDCFKRQRIRFHTATCCMPGCKGNYRNGSTASFFRFPKDEELRNKWIHAIHRKDFTLSNYARVCHLHFKDEDFMWTTSTTDDKTGEIITCKLRRTRELVPDAVPSIVNRQNYSSANARPSRDCSKTKKMAVEVSVGADGKNMFKTKYVCDICKGLYSSVEEISKHKKSGCTKQKSGNYKSFSIDSICNVITDFDDESSDNPSCSDEIVFPESNNSTKVSLNSINSYIDSICNVVIDLDDNGLSDDSISAKENVIPDLIEDSHNSNNSVVYESSNSNENVVPDSGDVCEVVIIDGNSTSKSVYPEICAICNFQCKNENSIFYCDYHQKMCIPKDKTKKIYPWTRLNRTKRLVFQHQSQCSEQESPNENDLPDLSHRARKNDPKMNKENEIFPHKGRARKNEPKMNIENETFPRNCEICGVLLKNKYYYFYHKKVCYVPKKSSIYPRVCESCNVQYKNRESFSVHKKRCGKPKKPSIYPRICESCKVQFKNCSSFNSHKKRCGSNRSGSNRSKKRSIYPRTCKYCKVEFKDKNKFYLHNVRYSKKEKKTYRVSCLERKSRAK